jgi:large subunit ribosomal protein L17
MKHRVGFNPLDRKPSHRKALHRNMVTSLFKHERIRTTKAKAKAIRRTAEKMITRAKVDSVHNRRMIFRDLKDKAILAKLFVEIGPRFKERPGGYTRMLKIGPRPGDGADMVLLELVGEMGEKSEEKPKRGDSGKKSAAPKAEKSKASKEKAPKTKAAEKAVEDVAAQDEAVETAVGDEPAAADSASQDSAEETASEDSQESAVEDEVAAEESDSEEVAADEKSSDAEK